MVTVPPALLLPPPIPAAASAPVAVSLPVSGTLSMVTDAPSGTPSPAANEPLFRVLPPESIRLTSAPVPAPVPAWILKAQAYDWLFTSILTPFRVMVFSVPLTGLPL